MSKRTSPTLIGLFAIGAVALSVAALLLWGGGGFFRRSLTYVLWFDSNVSGLNVGAPVEFRGVKIGEVTDIHLLLGTRKVGVYIRVEPTAIVGIRTGGLAAKIDQSVKAGMRAQLRPLSLVTGQLYISLDDFPSTPIQLTGIDPKTPELPTVPDPLQVWTDRARTVFEKIDRLPLDQVATALLETLHDAQSVLRSPELAHAIRGTDELIGDMRQFARQLETRTDQITAKLDTTMNQASELMGDARASLRDLTAKADPMLDSFRATSDTARAVLERTEGAVARMDRTLETAQGALERAELTLGSVDDTLADARTTLGRVDAALDERSALGYELFSALRQFRATGRSVQALTDYLDRHPDALLFGRGSRSAP